MMNREDWESLQACPGWPALRQYLRDVRDSMKEALAEAKAPYPETAHKAQMLKDLADLAWEDVAKFYNIPLPEVEQQDAA